MGVGVGVGVGVVDMGVGVVVGVAVGVGVGEGARPQAANSRIIARVSTGSIFIVLPTVIVVSPILEWWRTQIN